MNEQELAQQMQKTAEQSGWNERNIEKLQQDLTEMSGEMAELRHMLGNLQERVARLEEDEEGS